MYIILCITFCMMDKSLCFFGPRNTILVHNCCLLLFSSKRVLLFNLSRKSIYGHFKMKLQNSYIIYFVFFVFHFAFYLISSKTEYNIVATCWLIIDTFANFCYDSVGEEKEKIADNNDRFVKMIVFLYGHFEIYLLSDTADTKIVGCHKRNRFETKTQTSWYMEPAR